MNLKKSELEPKQTFMFVGYQYDLIQGVVRPTPERWEALNSKINSLLERSSCSVRQLISLIGLLTATEKQVPSGCFHMRPIQWHLKNHWHIPESHLFWWLKEENVLPGQNLHPLRHAVQIFTDASNKRWGAHLGDYTARGGWSVPESRLHINFLELKAVLLALKAFEPLCRGRVVLVATDNTTVIAYINKEGGMRSGSLCALLWRLLSWCNLREICLRARHIPGRLNVIADKLSRHCQVIQREWSLHLDVCSDLPQMASSQGGPICDEVQLQTTSVCVPSSRSQSMGRGCVDPVMGGSGPTCLSPSSPPDKCSDKGSQPSVQKDDNSSPGLAEHALVLGSGGDLI